LQFDASRSVGALFVDTLRLTGTRIEEIDEPARTMTGKHLIDFLAMAIESDARVLVGHSSSVRNAHLLRCEHFIRARLDNTRLTPQMVADGCGILLRYMRQIFEGEGITVGAYIRNQRLLMSDAMLRDPNCRKSISEIAYQWGFGDQAQFSRNYRSRFGCTPSDVRAACRAQTSYPQFVPRHARTCRGHPDLPCRKAWLAGTKPGHDGGWVIGLINHSNSKIAKVLDLLAKLRDSQISDDVFAARFSEHDGDLGATGQVFEGDVLGPMLDRGEGDVFSRPTHEGEFRQPALLPCRHQCARPSDGRAMARRDRIKR
jgi:AraC-like DNA-binding protein